MSPTRELTRTLNSGAARRRFEPVIRNVSRHHVVIARLAPLGIGLAAFATTMLYALVDIYVFDHFDRMLGRGITLGWSQIFAAYAALVSLVGFIAGLRSLEAATSWRYAVVAGIVLSAAYLAVATGVEYLTGQLPDAFGWFSFLTLAGGGFMLALVSRYARSNLPANLR